MPEIVTLREFKYFDRQIVEDFLSSIEGGLATESRSSLVSKGRNISGEVGVSVAKLSIQKGTTDVSKEETKTLGDAALFQRLYDAISRLNMIRQSSEIDSIKQGDLIELTGVLELPFFEKALDIFGQLSSFMQTQAMNPQGLAMFGLLSKSETLNVRIHVVPEIKTALVAVLSQRNLRPGVPKLELEDNFTGLYRVKRRLQENETFDILKLPVKLSQKMTNDLLKNVSNMPDNVVDLLGKKPTEDDLQVHYPATILTPVAIYQ